MNILNGQEAFAAMASGQTIECRSIESLLDFDDIRNFSATVFIDVAYEFRVAVVYMTIGSMRVPEGIKEAPAKGTECFVPSILTEALTKSIKWKNSESDFVLMQRGQVHLYEQHAKIHAEALIKISGGALIDEAETDNDPPFDIPEKVESVVIDKAQTITITEQTNLTVLEDSLVTLVEPTPRVKNDFEIEMENEIAADKQLEYETLLKDLVDRAAIAATVAEANALINYTKTWFAEQRRPLITAINKRLVELKAESGEVIQHSPSLMIRIEKAVDANKLYELTAEVRTRHPDIQPKLMDCINKRRFELENQTSEVAS